MECQMSVTCANCGKSFSRTRKKFMRAVRKGSNQFCSLECRCAFQTTKETVSCFNCGKLIQVHKSNIAKSKSGRSFCSNACSAVASNTGRVHTEETRGKISKGIDRYNTIKGVIIDHTPILCVVCNESFKPLRANQKTCSRDCGYFLQFGFMPLTKEEVIDYIQSVVKQMGHIPGSKHVSSSLMHAAVKFFGSWNKTMLSLGFQPNIQRTHRIHVRCSDGHIADSLSERVLDDWLYRQGIKHERSKQYPYNNHNCDFYLPDYDIWLEYFGMWGNNPVYDQTVGFKYFIASELNLNLVGVTANMLFPTITLTLEDILENKIPPLVVV